MVKVGIIGGSGVYDPNLFEDPKKIKVHTPYGRTSDFVTVPGKHKNGSDLIKKSTENFKYLNTPQIYIVQHIKRRRLR